MPKPYIFASRTELIQELQAPATQELAGAFFAKRSETIASVTLEGVGSNTFRAFRNLPVRPSIAFRSWTTKYIEQSLTHILTIDDRAAFAQYIDSSTIALNQYWSSHTGSDMGYGRGAKLLNLVLKKLACYSAITPEQRTLLISLLHVPLDSYTIVGLLSVAPQFNIPKSATMKHIATPAQYTDFQNLIVAITKEAGVPTIYYDILSWDRAH